MPPPPTPKGGKAHQGCVKIHPFTTILHSRLSTARTLASFTLMSLLPNACFTPSIDPNFLVYFSVYVHSPSPSIPPSPICLHPSSPCAQTISEHERPLCSLASSPFPFEIAQGHYWSRLSTSLQPCSSDISFRKHSTFSSLLLSPPQVSAP